MCIARSETTGKPATIQLVPDRVSINADGEDLSIVTVTVRDAQDKEVADADNLIHFALDGRGTIIGVGNGNPSSHERDKCLTGSWQRSLFNGNCQVIIQAGRAGGTMTLRASSEGLRGTAMTVQAQSSESRPFVPE